MICTTSLNREFNPRIVLRITNGAIFSHLLVICQLLGNGKLCYSSTCSSRVNTGLEYVILGSGVQASYLWNFWFFFWPMFNIALSNPRRLSTMIITITNISSTSYSYSYAHSSSNPPAQLCNPTPSAMLLDTYPS